MRVPRDRQVEDAIGRFPVTGLLAPGIAPLGRGRDGPGLDHHVEVEGLPDQDVRIQEGREIMRPGLCRRQQLVALLVARCECALGRHRRQLCPGMGQVFAQLRRHLVDLLLGTISNDVSAGYVPAYGRRKEDRLNGQRRRVNDVDKSDLHGFLNISLINYSKSADWQQFAGEYSQTRFFSNLAAKQDAARQDSQSLGHCLLPKTGSPTGAEQCKNIRSSGARLPVLSRSSLAGIWRRYPMSMSSRRTCPGMCGSATPSSAV